MHYKVYISDAVSQYNHLIKTLKLKGVEKVENILNYSSFKIFRDRSFKFDIHVIAKT